jgi:hypothetical protein
MVTNRNIVDIVAGCAIFAIGVFVAVVAVSFHKLGTLGNMGPGMFPAIVGTVVAIFGAVIALPAALRAQVFEVPQFELRPALGVLTSIAVFAICVRPFGLAPAVVAMTFVAALADSRARVLPTVVLAAALAVLAVLIFIVGLRLPLAIYQWPF